MDEILSYLKQKYDPVGLILYGSYADGSNNLNSDFDALLIYDGKENLHDHSTVNGTELDVFLYPQYVFVNEYDVHDFIQVWDGKIIVDKTGVAVKLKENVCNYIRSYTGKSKEENEHNLAWCEKMLRRTERNDMEGLFRLHSLLVDSLEIYYDLKGLYYFGPKKAIRQLSQTDPDNSEIYYQALKEPTEANLSNWIRCLRNIWKQ